MSITVDKKTDIILRQWKSEDNQIGLAMTLMRNAHFYGYKPGPVITIYGLDYAPDGSAHCVGSEHYKPEDLMLAMEAFDERLEKDIFHPSSKVYSTFAEMNYILEKDDFRKGGNHC